MSKIIGNPTTTPMAIPDYNQNNEKKADYIKNRPFYTGNTIVLDERDVDIPWSFKSFTLSKSLDEFSPGDSVIVEIMGDATIGNSRVETVLNEECKISEISTSDNKWGLWGYGVCFDLRCDADPDPHTVSVVVTVEGVAKKLDSKFLDMEGISNEVLKDVGVKYIKSEYGQYLMTEELISIEDIPTGSYVLDGLFRTSTNQEVYTFTRGAMFCQVHKVGNKTILHYTDISAGEPLIRTETYVNGQCTSRHEIDFAAYATNLDVHNAIGDVETALDNIIAKYGLGGDA